MDIRTFRWARAALIPLAVTGALLVACSDDEGEAEAEATATEAMTATAEGTGEAMGEALEVTTVDFGYEGLPEKVAAGTKITLVNTSEAELHEFVAILLPEGETRTAAELAALPMEELGALLGTGHPETVILATPGSGADANIVAVGDGTLNTPGRYLVICAIPTGIAPEAYLEAAAASGGEAPQVEGGGAPHFVAGMFAEVTVE